MADAMEVALEAGRRRLREISIPRGSRVLVMVDGHLLAAKVERVGQIVGDEVRVEVFTGSQWPSFVMDRDDFEAAYASDDGDPWLDVAVGCTRYRLALIVAAKE